MTLQYRFSRSTYAGWLRRLSVTLLAIVGVAYVNILQTGCCPDEPRSPLRPHAGLPHGWRPQLVQFPNNVYVKAADGGLWIRRKDLTIDTRLGTFWVGATYSSGNNALASTVGADIDGWYWNFDDLYYDNGEFVDDTGHYRDINGLNPGDTIPGTHWVKVSQEGDGQGLGNRIKSKGGLLYIFHNSGRLRVIRYTSSIYPQLRFSIANFGDGQHLTGMDQCYADGTCDPVFTFNYLPNGQLSNITDRAGRRATYSYDADGRLQAARDQHDLNNSASGFTYTYLGSGNALLSVTNSEGVKVGIGYDGPRVSEVRHVQDVFNVRKHRFVYDDETDVCSERFPVHYFDAMGNEFLYVSDSLRRLKELTHVATGETRTYVWQNADLVEQTAPNGATTKWTYDNGDPIEISLPNGNVVHITYAPTAIDRDNPYSRPVAKKWDSLNDPSRSWDFIEQRTYDANGRLLSVTNNTSETATYTYSSTEMVASVTDPQGATTEFSDYGEHGHPRTIITPDGNSHSITYDAVGNHLSGHAGDYAPERGGLVSRQYNADRLISQIQMESWDDDATVETIWIVRRSDGRVKEIRRPGGGDHILQYDGFGQKTKQLEYVDGQWRTTKFFYDANGRLITMLQPNGMRREAAYDGLGRLTDFTTRWQGSTPSTTVTYTYVDGLLDRVDDSTASGPKTYSYDSAGRVRQINFPSGRKLAIEYDKRSRITQEWFLDANGTFVWIPSYVYDKANRLLTTRVGGNTLVDRTYTDGRISEITYGNGLTRTFTYGSGGLLRETHTRNAAGDAIERNFLSYFLGVSNDITVYSPPGTVEDDVSMTHYTGGIDEGERLIMNGAGGESAPIWASANYVQGDVVWDTLNNVNPDRFTYNAQKNRLLTARRFDHPDLHYQYDAAGFVVSRGGSPLTWTAAGKLASHGSDTFQWNGEGQIVSRTVNGETETRLWGNRVRGDAAGNPIALDLGEVQVALDGSELYRHYDYRGDVQFLTDESGSLVSYYAYGGFGDIGVYKTDADSAGFLGKDQPSEIMIVGARVYDPAVGRFLSPDPVLSPINQYVYGDGNPVHFQDPSGLYVVDTLNGGVWGLAGGTAVAGATAAGAAIGGPLGPVFAVAANLAAQASVYIVGGLIRGDLRAPTGWQIAGAIYGAILTTGAMYTGGGIGYALGEIFSLATIAISGGPAGGGGGGPPPCAGDCRKPDSDPGGGPGGPRKELEMCLEGSTCPPVTPGSAGFAASAMSMGFGGIGSLAGLGGIAYTCAPLPSISALSSLGRAAPLVLPVLVFLVWRVRREGAR